MVLARFVLQLGCIREYRARSRGQLKLLVRLKADSVCSVSNRITDHGRTSKQAGVRLVPRRPHVT
jgi:hypothetical protein